MRASRYLILLIALSKVCHAQYFPLQVFDGKNPSLDKFVAGWYGRQLRALGEPSLYVQSKMTHGEAYRFLWLRTFHHPIAIRITPNPDGSGLLVVKMADGEGGYAPGKLIQKTVKPLSHEQMSRFLSLIQQSKFWDMPTSDLETAGNDGSEWIMEGESVGRYHIVDRWTPKQGLIRELGTMLVFDFAGLKIPAAEIY